jgi:hypothetical protein
VTEETSPGRPNALVRFAALKSSRLLFESLAQQLGKRHWTRSPAAQHAAADQEPYDATLLIVAAAFFALVFLNPRR